MTGIHFGNEDEVSNIRCRTGVSGRPRLVTNFARIEGEGTSVVTCAVDTSATGAGIWAVQLSNNAGATWGGSFTLYGTPFWAMGEKPFDRNVSRGGGERCEGGGERSE